MKINEKNHTALSKAISGSNHSINETNSLGDTKIVEFDQPDNANHADKANRQHRDQINTNNNTAGQDQLSRDLQVRQSKDGDASVKSGKGPRAFSQPAVKGSHNSQYIIKK